MGRVHQMIVENFKSYEGRVLVGPFRHFTCIIGPNGAGKSNLMDAISFVLGVQARVLRSEKLRDLVYRKEGEDPKGNQRTAMVELTYHSEATEGEGAPGSAAAEGPSVLVFRRSILRGGEARFQINDETVPQADYQSRLESINILSKVRNFLVFQGDVEAVAHRQGKELTAFFEQISGSEAFRQEYERLAAEKGKVEDNVRYLFTKKRNAINEKKRVAHQKQEADEYRRLEAGRRDMQREFFLFRLHGIARQQEEAEAAEARIKGESEEIGAATKAIAKQLQTREKERAQAHLATTQAERALAGARARLDRLNPELVACQSKLAFLQQRHEDLQQNADRQGRRHEKLKEHAQGLREEQAKAEAEQRDLAERLQQRDPRFTPEQKEEFERVQRDTERITAMHADRTRELEHQIRAIAAERTRMEHEQREANALREHLVKKVADLREAEAVGEQTAAETAETFQQCRRALARVRTSVSEYGDEKDQLQEERRQLLDTIQDITATERQLAYERQIAQTCANLKNAVPGVHGRVIELCRPSQKRLHVAVNVAMGKFLDAVVVESGDVARQCVRYLKERMLPPMTFLPLGDLRVTPADPRLEEFVGGRSSLRLALNCVAFEERFARAFEFLLGDVVVADTMADGRRLAFTDAQALGLSCKIVTLAGEAIAKNGNLSVNSEAAREGATRFDLSEVDTAKARLDTVDRRLRAIHADEASGNASEAALTDEAQRAEVKSGEANARFEWCRAQCAQKTEECRAAEAALAGIDPEVARLTRDESQLRDEQRRLEEHISKSVASHFARLSAAMGVDDVRKVVFEWRREQQAVQLRSDELARQHRNVVAELSMIEQTIREESERRPADLAPKILAEIEQLNAKQESFKKDADSLSAEMQGVEASARQCAEAERESERALSKLRHEGKEKRQELMALEKRAVDLATERRKLNETRTDILRQSVLEDVEVPLIRGGFEALQDIAEAPSQPASAPTQQEAPCDQSAAAVAIDFETLPSEKQAASSGPAAKMLEEEYRSELERLRVELQRLSPNLKAIDQMQSVVENVQAASHEADAARREIEDVDAQFEAVRKARKERFLACFQKVAGDISAIYRRLTANTAGLHADGGSAYLDLEDTEDPFNGGIKFTAMPPAKRFRDMHLLSGGEKTLAAMALLFAVHSFQKPPFMVLDEVDAALDANNVQALANYVEQSNCQTIVISLKDRFFIKGEALVGVWKNKPKETSAVLSLDLTRYPATV
mmetsp:Transcript_81832/g.227946  ORF Transcript_81832/g.227946 Transcript_81832/m.227946 type:complete len:1243 (-) Transcript_81832:110-3838(-)